MTPMPRTIIPGATCPECHRESVAAPTDLGRPIPDRHWCLECGHLWTPEPPPERQSARLLGQRGGRANSPAQQAIRRRPKAGTGVGRPRLPEISAADVRRLAAEARVLDDFALVAACARALEGSRRAWVVCQRAARARGIR
jgi:hypothetical protein